MGTSGESIGRSRWLVAAIGLTVCVFVISHLPLPEGTFPADLGTGVGDKVPHGVVYGGLAWLYLLALASRGHSLWRPIGVVLLVLAIGAVDEVTQLLVGRSCSLIDWLADVVGISLAGVVWGVWLWVSPACVPLPSTGGAELGIAPPRRGCAPRESGR